MSTLSLGTALGALMLSLLPVAASDGMSPGKPVPVQRLAQSQAMTGAPAIKAGDLTIEQPWLRATPAGAKVAGGYLRVTNHGTQVDRLVAASIPLAPRGEVHEMTVIDGIMKMREVDGGIEIGPGQTVELKPGGFHLMFLDLTAGPKLGEPVRGTLTFQRAGTVDVTFDVAPIGAPGPVSHH